MYCHFVKDIISYLRLQCCALMHLNNIFILYFVCNIILYLVFNSSVVHCPQIFIFIYLYEPHNCHNHTISCVDEKYLKSTCDVSLLSKLSIMFKEWRVIVLFVLLRSQMGQII
jgi:hypothetical protein